MPLRFFGWFVQVVKEKCAEHFDVLNYWSVADGHIFDVRDRTDGQMYTVKITPQVKDWRTA
jgi:hypothetical protein